MKGNATKKLFCWVLVLVLVIGLVLPNLSDALAKELAGGFTVPDDRIAVIKTLDGKQPGDKTFSFELYAADENGNAVGGPLQTVQNGPKGNAVFNAIPYTAAGEYRYVVKEVNDGQAGIIYDPQSERLVTVSVAAEDVGGATNVEDSQFPQQFTTNFTDWGEDTEVRLNGPIVMDGNGAVLTGAQVTLTRKSTGAKLYTWISDNGGLNIKLRNGESYIVSAVKNGYTISSQEFGVYAQASQIPGGATGIAANWEVYAYTNQSNGHLGEKSVQYNSNTPDVVYCINRALSASPKDYPTRYGKQLTAENLAEELRWNTSYAARQLGSDMATGYLSDSTVLSGNDALPGLKKILWNGYPNNASGKQYSYEDTQRAVFAWAHAGKSEKAAAGSAYLGSNANARELWNMAVYGGGAEVPDGFNVNIYTPVEGHRAQSLIGGRFHFNGSTTKKFSVDVTVYGNKAAVGKLVAKAGTVNFNNTTTKSFSAVIEGLKVLNGAGLKAGQFSFQLMDSNGTVLQTVKNDAQGRIVFDPITYAEKDLNGQTENVLTYYIKEVEDGQANIVYDTETKAVQVVLKGTQTTETLEAPVFQTEDPNFPQQLCVNYSDWGEDTAVRLNGPIVVDANGSPIIGAQVTLTRKSTGAKLYTWISDNGGLDTKLMNRETYVLSAVKNGYNIPSQEFTVSAADNQVPGGATGVIANWEEYTYINNTNGHLGEKTVRYNGRELDVVYCINRALSASPSDYPTRSGKPLTAENLAEELRWNTSFASRQLGSDMATGYLSDSTVLSGYDALPGLKKIIWNGYPNNAGGKQYSYEDTQRAIFAWAHAGRSEKAAASSAYLGNNSNARELWNMAVYGGGAEVPAGFNLNIYTPTTGHRAQSLIGGRFHFTGNSSKSFETSVALRGVPAVAETVSVFKLNSVEAGSFRFENGYQKEEEKVSITVRKKWVDTDGQTEVAAPEGASVRLQVMADGVAVEKQVATITAAHNWTFTFTNLPKYQADGKTPIQYTVSEVAFSGNGFSTGSVTQVSENLWEAVNRKMPREENGVAPARLKLSAKKLLEGGELQAGQFSFTLEGTGLATAMLARNDASGNIVFPEITYTKAGTYIYTIKESNDAQTGISYDLAARSVTVVVKDNGSGLVIESIRDAEGRDLLSQAVVTYTDGGSLAPAITSGKAYKNKDVDYHTDSQYKAYGYYVGGHRAYCLDLDAKIHDLMEGSHKLVNYSYRPGVAPSVNMEQLKKIVYYGWPNDNGAIENSGNNFGSNSIYMTNATKRQEMLWYASQLALWSLTNPNSSEFQTLKAKQPSVWRIAENGILNRPAVPEDFRMDAFVFTSDSGSNLQPVMLVKVGSREQSVTAELPADAAFRNSISMETALNIQLEKAIEGLTGIYPSFKFTLTGQDEASAATIVTGTRWTNANTYKLNNPFNLKFTAAGTYLYTVSEDKDPATYAAQNIDLQGVQLDAPDQTVRVIVERIGNTLQVSSVEGASLNGMLATLTVKFANTKPEEPAIGTTATDNADNDKIVAVIENAEVKDVVKYSKLIPGREYTMEGQLVKKSDASAVVATASTTFTASESGSGEVTLVFTFDARDLAGESLVAFETAKKDGEVVATHADINDADQTVEVENPNPEIKTTATDNSDGDKVVAVIEKAEVKDVVKYSKLIPGKEYTMEGQLVKKSDASVVVATASTTFTASESGSGEETLVFTFDARDLAGESLVAFETAKKDGEVVATHADINDADQTVEVENPNPEIKTTATDNSDG
ncbi:MAG: VaFE repeat-containing surface-anchored protein, partial [Lachnospiraceae bacterium]|nr:VaFE repeat-containing surface-anchored protein [Lachnospiraceae bacterium]